MENYAHSERARARGHQAFKYGVSSDYSDAKLQCNVTTDLVGINKIRIVLGKQRLSRNIASVRRYNDREVGHLFRKFYSLLLTIFSIARRETRRFHCTVMLFDF